MNNGLTRGQITFVLARLFEVTKTPEQIMKYKEELETTKKPHNSLHYVNMHEVVNAFAIMLGNRNAEEMQEFCDMVEQDRLNVKRLNKKEEEW